RSWGRRRVMPLSSRCLASCRPSLCGIETINGCDIALLGVTPRFRRDCSQKPDAPPEWANCDEAYYLTPATATHIQLLRDQQNVSDTGSGDTGRWTKRQRVPVITAVHEQSL